MSDSEIAYAKLNLALHVRRREPDGYHALETLFAFCEDGDVVAPRAQPGLAIVGPFGEGLASDDNLVTRAADGFAAAFGIDEPAGFVLDKRLPVAAGIGGGSADAAAALRILARRHGIALGDPRLIALAAGLGADVPACLASSTQRGEARGDVLEPIRSGALAGLPVLLANPRVALPTGPVFAGWDRIDRGPLGHGDPLAAARAGRNDLTPSAMALRPEIGAVLALLDRQGGVMLARMSGSGATCFALFDDVRARDRAAAGLAAEQPGWWLLASRLR